MIPSGDGKFGDENWFTPRRFVVLLVLLLAATYPDVLTGRATFFYRDFALFGYPLAHYVRESYWRGEIPLWNPYNDCGVPFLAQWNTLALYPLSLIYVLLPLSWSLGLFCLGHLLIAGLGMYFLAYRWTGSRYVATFAGLSFSLSPFILNFLMWPNNVAAMGWCPWILLASQRAWRHGGTGLPLAVLASAMQMLSGAPEVILLTWVLCALLALSDLMQLKDWRIPARLILIGSWTASLSAVQLLPFLDLLCHSQRDKGFGGSLWSMPVWGWANFLVPLHRNLPTTLGTYAQPGQFWISTYYLGIGVIALALTGLAGPRTRPALILGSITVLCLLLALGSKGIAYEALNRVFPGLGFFRYPIKFVILPAMVVPLLAALGLHRCLTAPVSGWPREQARLLRVGLILLAIIAGLIWSAFQFPFEGTSPWVAARSGASRGVLLVLTLVGILGSRVAHGVLLRRTARLGLLLVVWLDALSAGPRPNPTVPRGVYESNLARRELNLQPAPYIGQARVMLNAEAEGRLMTVPMTNATEQVLYSRLALYADANLLDDMPKVVGLYSLYARESGEVLSRLWKTPEPPAGLVDFLGVSHISSPGRATQWETRKTALPWATAGQTPVFLDTPQTLARLGSADFEPHTTVFLRPEEQARISVTNGSAARVITNHWTPHRVEIEVEAPEPALLVIAQTFYHNWDAFVEGHSKPLLRANHAFQAVEIASGRHRVELVYRDRAFRWGVFISAASLVACLGFYFMAHKRLKRAAQGPTAS